MATSSSTRENFWGRGPPGEVGIDMATLEQHHRDTTEASARSELVSRSRTCSGWSLPLISLALVGLVPFLIVPAVSASPTSTRTKLVSLSSDGSQGNRWSGSPFVAVSADGRFVALDSKASNLVAGDTNGASDVFVRDRATDKTTRVSVSSSGEQANSMSQYPAISPDGRFVTFDSRASNLVSGDTNGKSDVFVHDLVSGRTTRVNVSSSGNQANRGSLYSAISKRGRFVAFTSGASNLVPRDTNGKVDVFVRDLSKRRTFRVSVSSAEHQGNGFSLITLPASVSADGRFVVFTSKASNLVPADTNNKLDVFVRDVFRGTTARVSLSSAGGQGNERSSSPAISASGRFVVFSSDASNLVRGDTNRFTDVFLRDRSKGKTERVSVSSAGRQGNFISCCSKGVSEDGRFVAFTSLASNLVARDRNGNGDVFLRDRLAGTTTAVSVSLSGRTGNADSGNVSFSTDGRFAAFASLASDLVSNDRNGFMDVFIRGPLR